MAMFRILFPASFTDFGSTGLFNQTKDTALILRKWFWIPTRDSWVAIFVGRLRCLVTKLAIPRLICPLTTATMPPLLLWERCWILRLLGEMIILRARPGIKRSFMRCTCGDLPNFIPMFQKPCRDAMRAW